MGLIQPLQGCGIVVDNVPRVVPARRDNPGLNDGMLSAFGFRDASSIPKGIAPASLEENKGSERFVY